MCARPIWDSTVLDATRSRALPWCDYAAQLEQEASGTLRSLCVVGCRCRSSPAELAAYADVSLVEDGQIKVAVAPLTVLIIDAHLLTLAEFAVLLARWRDLL